MHQMGYSLKEIDEMDIGFMRDMILEKYNAYVLANKKQDNKSSGNTKQHKSSVRWATQEDFDRL